MTDIPNKQLETMQMKLDTLHSEVTKLTILVEKLHEERKQSNIKLDRLDKDFSNIQGALALLKGLSLLLSGSAIAFCTWIVTSQIDQQKQLTINSQKIAYLETRLGISYDKHNQNQNTD